MQATGRAAAVVAGGLLLAGVAVPRAGAAPRVRTWRVSRASAARPLPFAMTVRVTASGPRDAVLIVEVTGTGAARRVGNATFSESASTLPAAYGAGPGVALCPAAPGCDVADPVPQEYHVSSDGRAVRSEYLIVTENAAAAVGLGAAGWRVREVAPLRLRRVAPQETGAVGASSRVVTAEQYSGTSAPGGRYGSFAWAFLACDAGQGRATLATAPRLASTPPKTWECGSTGGGGATAYAIRAVTWTVTASAVGAGTAASRLVVLDLPKS